MKRYLVWAVGELDKGLLDHKRVIDARSDEEAEEKARVLYDEHKEVYVCAMD